MKSPTLSRSGKHANVILVALILSAILGLALASYLIMAQQQNMSIYRSQNWNTVMPTAEAGIEDGLQSVNRFAGQFVDIEKWTNYAAADGWDVNGSIWHMHRTIGENIYDVWVTNQPPAPTIASLAQTPWRYASASSLAGQPFFAQAGGGQVLPGQIARKIWIRTKRDPLFTVAMAALNSIDLKGNKITTDSFDSSSTNYSINGLYPIGHPEMTRDQGDVATDSSIVDSLNVGNADIKGHIRTGPGANTYSIGSQGSVGSKAWVEGGSLGVQPGWASTDFNVAFDPVSYPPDAKWLPATEKNDYINGVKYQYVFDTSGDYFINGSLNGSVYVTNNVDVRIKITQNVISSSLVIRISPENAKMQIFMAGSTFSLSGSAFVDNASGHPDRFFLYGLPSCTSITYGGNGNFYGCIYAPNADYNLGGGGADTWDFVGSSVTSSVVMNGHFNFHFDENLKNVGPAKAFVATAWQEIAAQ